MEIKDECYYQVTGWMKNRLCLKGSKRDIYAIIYGFSQDGKSEFTGSLAYLTEWLDISKPTVIKALQELVEQNLIIKRVENINGVIFNRYKANLEILPLVKKFNWGSKEILLGDSKEILPNNNIIKNNNLNNSNIIVLDYLNERAGTHYKPVESNFKFINARLKDYSIEDLKAVIDKKVAEWKGTEFEKYLTPETLFRPSNFEKYLNQKIIQKNNAGMMTRNYTKEQLNELYDNLDDTDI